MQIVIDIPEKIFKELTKYDKPVPSGNCLYDSILESVFNGISLPKGHGKLGDLDELEVLMKDEILNHDLNEYGCLNLVKHTQAIIEADEEDEE